MNEYKGAIWGLAALLSGAAGAQPPDIIGSPNAITGIGTGVFTGVHGTPLTDAETAGGYFALHSVTDTESGRGSHQDTAFGTRALANDLGDLWLPNTAFGAHAMSGAVTGDAPGTFGLNTAIGSNAMTSIVSGMYNVAAGYNAMYSASTADYNTAVGSSALYHLKDGIYNTALGYVSLNTTVSGGENVAAGAYSLQAMTTAYYNAALGYQSLNKNTVGLYNAAVGAQSLAANVDGGNNLGVGDSALHHAIHGNFNVGIGYQALLSTVSGSSNVAIGSQAGYAITGSNNVDIGNQGQSVDDGVIRIGTNGTHTAAYVAGIYGSTLTGAAVYINSSGQLGVLASSQRYKKDISAMAGRSAKLGGLRPVSFHLKSEPDGAVQYGLIAEEVVKEYPDLVTRDAQGRLDGVRYDELAPLLINEMQRLQREHVLLRHRTDALIASSAKLRASINGRAIATASNLTQR